MYKENSLNLDFNNNSIKPVLNFLYIVENNNYLNYKKGCILNNLSLYQSD
jgi:hypothetical protein